MSSEAVVEFVNRSEADPTLKEALSETRGAADVVRVASEYGFAFTVEELEPIVSLLRFLQDVTADEDLQDALGYAPDAAAVVELAERRGYRFSVAELERVSLTDAAELSELELETVSGGAGIRQQPRAGLRVQLSQVTQRETPKTDFGTALKSGLSKSTDIALAAGSIAAPFIPGGTVVSAAVSSVGGLKSSLGS